CGRQRGTAIDEAAGDRLSDRVAVLPDRIGQAGRWVIHRCGTGDVQMSTFSISPAVIASGAGSWFVVHLFPSALTDVGDVQRTVTAARRHVERVAPRIAQAEAPNFFLHSRRS